MRYRSIRTVLGASIVIGASLAVMAASPAQAVAPQGKNYAVAFLFRIPELNMVDAEILCIRFAADEVCDETGSCGSWDFTELAGRQNEWAGSIEVDFEGLPVTLEFRGITERLGAKSSIAGTVYIPELRANGAISGVQLRRDLCLEAAQSDD